MVDSHLGRNKIVYGTALRTDSFGVFLSIASDRYLQNPALFRVISVFSQVLCLQNLVYLMFIRVGSKFSCTVTVQ